MYRLHKYEDTDGKGTCSVQVPDPLMGYETTVRCGHTKEEHEEAQMKK